MNRKTKTFTGEKGTVSPVTRKHHAKKMRLSVRLVLPVESAGGALFDAGAAVQTGSSIDTYLLSVKRQGSSRTHLNAAAAADTVFFAV